MSKLFFLIAVPGLLSCLLLGCSSPEDNNTNNSNNVNDMGKDLIDLPADMVVNKTTMLRVASFNSALSRTRAGQLLDNLETKEDAKAKAIAHIIQRQNPDIILLNEFDWDASGATLKSFQTHYLNVPQSSDLEGLDYKYVYIPTTNTGEPSNQDLDKSGMVVTQPGSRDYGGDAFGYGEFPGQYGMVVLSKYPLNTTAARSFQKLLWKDMPDNLQPTAWYPTGAAEAMRLSSKNHVDISADVNGHTVHLLISHPTPPGFDGDEDRNGARNHDEIRLWLDYISQKTYLKDDANVAGGLPDGASFVILGDLNADPKDGGSVKKALTDLLAHPRVQDPAPVAKGGESAAQRDGQVNTQHVGDPKQDTANFSDGEVGNLRVDYALPSTDMTVIKSGIYWPAPDEPFADLVKASDHRMVWVDLQIKHN